MATYTFDFDGTVARFPERFAPLVSALTASGHRAMIVSGRKSEDGISDFLSEHNFPDMEVRTRGDSIWPSAIWKARELESLGSSMHFDDDGEVKPTGVPIALMGQEKSRYGALK